jgi:hypothetical protein
MRAFLVVALVLSVFLLGAAKAEPRKEVSPPAVESRPATPRVECPLPPTLHLARFEDGSARLECAHRLLVRVTVPG